MQMTQKKSSWSVIKWASENKIGGDRERASRGKIKSLFMFSTHQAIRALCAINENINWWLIAEVQAPLVTNNFLHDR